MCLCVSAEIHGIELQYSCLGFAIVCCIDGVEDYDSRSEVRVSHGIRYPFITAQRKMSRGAAKYIIRNQFVAFPEEVLLVQIRICGCFNIKLISVVTTDSPDLKDFFDIS